MMNLSRWKIGLVLIAVIGGILLSLPNFLPAGVRDSVRNFLPTKTLNLGLDLQGGSYLLMQVDTDALVRERTTNLVEDVRSRLTEANIPSGTPGASGASVNVRITNPADVDTALADLSKLASPLPKSPGSMDMTVVKGPNQTIVMTLTDQGINDTASRAVDTSLEVIRRRIDPNSIRELSLVRQGVNRVILEAPGESNPEELKRLIGQTAKLTFQMVDETVSPADMAANRIPPGSEMLPDDEVQKGGQLVVHKRVIVSGASLTKADVETDQYQRPAIGFTFDGAGAQKFGQATAENIGHRFAIILDGRVVSAPNIIGAITGGRGQITGNFTAQSASELVNVLNGGALPAPLKFIEQRTVTASLGADSVLKGAHATAIAFASVVVFMLLAYGFQFGGYSVASLVTNLVMLVGGMSLFGATLTLPGIAGLILTLAMAVDANVLIYERMRDELRSGKNLIGALDSGFTKALETILDANITTLVAALIMYSFGTSTVKGFAVTLALGTFTSVFSSVMVTQVLVATWYKLFRPKTMAIADNVAPKAWPLIKALPKKTDIHFVNFARLAATLSIIAVCGSLFLTVVGDQAPLWPLKAPCGGLTCGVDFKGGTKLEMNTGTTDPNNSNNHIPGPVIDMGGLRTTLEQQGLKDVQVQGAGTVGDDVIMKFESPSHDPVGKVEAVKGALLKTYPQAHFSNTEVVGAEVSGELLTLSLIHISEPTRPY